MLKFPRNYPYPGKVWDGMTYQNYQSLRYGMRSGTKLPEYPGILARNYPYPVR